MPLWPSLLSSRFHITISHTTPTSCSCIERHHKKKKKKQQPPATTPAPPTTRFQPPGGPGGLMEEEGKGPAATLFMASDELLPVLGYVVCLVRFFVRTYA